MTESTQGSPIYKALYGLLIALVGLCCTAPTLFAQPQGRFVTLSWDPSEDATAIGSFLYYWQLPSGPTNKVPVTGNTHTLDNLAEGITYGFFLTATNAQGLESEPSNVIEFTPLTATEDTSLPDILSVLEPRATASNFTLTSSEYGTLTPPNGPPPLAYLPEPNYSGKAVLTYELNEGSTEPVRGWVSVLVAEGNDDPPVIPSTIPLIVRSGVPFDLTVPVTDPDTPLDMFSFRILQDPIYGSLLETAYRSNSTFHLVYANEVGPSHPGQDEFTLVTTLNTDPPQDFYTTANLTVAGVGVTPPSVGVTPLFVDIGWSRQVTLPAPALLNAAVTDTAGTEVTDATLAWFLINGPAPVTFDSPNTLVTRAMFTAPGTYIVALSAASNGSSGVASRTIEVVALTDPDLVSVFVEAEDGNPSGTTAFTTETTPGGETVRYASTSSSSDELDCTFEVPETGDYVIWCRVKTRSGGTDSFFVSMDDSREDIYDASAERYSQEYQWTALSGRAGNTDNWAEYAYTENARIFSLRAGQHTLTFRGRESGTRLDCFMVVNQSAVNPLTATHTYRPTTQMVADTNGVNVGWNAIKGLKYQIEHAASLFGPWTLQSTTTATETGDVMVDDPVGSGFYRVSVLE